MGKAKDDYSEVRRKAQRASILIAEGLSESRAAKEVGLPRSSLQRYLANGLPDGPIWIDGAQCPSTSEERKRMLEALQPLQDQPAQRDDQGHFLPGNQVGKLKNRPAREAKAKLEKFCPEVAERLIRVFKNLPSSQPELILAFGREILDRGIGKPKQVLDVTETSRSYEEYVFVQKLIGSDADSIRAAAALAQRLEKHAWESGRTPQPGQVEIIPPPV